MNKLLRVIENKVDRLREAFDFSDELKIDVKVLAKKMGLEVSAKSMPDDVSGLLVIEDSLGKIAYNRTNSKPRIRFTIAHEIGHYHLKHSRTGSLFIVQVSITKYRNARSSAGTDWQEREANAFAAALLMPRHLVKREYARYSFDPFDVNNDDMEKMAKSFNVSKQAMAIRLSNLGYLAY